MKIERETSTGETNSSLCRGSGAIKAPGQRAKIPHFCRWRPTKGAQQRPRTERNHGLLEISICVPARGKFVGQRRKSRKVSRVKGFSQGRRSLNKIQAACGARRPGMKAAAAEGEICRQNAQQHAQTESDDKRLFRQNEQLLQSFNSVVNWQASPPFLA